MRTAVATYDPKMVTIAWGGMILSGFAEGTFIKITRNGNAFDKKRGAGGDVERVNKNAYDFQVELTLLQTSTSNANLSVALTADQVSNVGVLPLIIKDLLGTTLFTAPQAWIAKDPDAEFGDDTSSRAWLFETGAAGSLLGGN